MTVKILTAAQKAAVVTIYTSNVRPSSIKHLAEVLCVSTRTIGRVLEEHKVRLPVLAKLSPEAVNIMALLYRHKISYQQLENLLDRLPMDTVALLTQTKRNKKSPTSHNGKQTLLPLNFPTSLELH